MEPATRINAGSAGHNQAQSEGIRKQLSDTSAELRKSKQRQQQLEARNVLLEKVAELNTVQQSRDCLDWEVSCICSRRVVVS